MRSWCIIFYVCQLVATFVLAIGIAPRAQAQEATSQDVRNAINAGVRYLKSQQNPDGTWPDYGQPGGATALATLALINAEVSRNDRALVRAADALPDISTQYTYTTALKISAMVALDEKRYHDDIEQAARALIKMQQKSDGLWSYSAAESRSDLSNSQFALLGLHEASIAGVKIPSEVWRRSERAWIQSQQREGGWGYVPKSSHPSGSMTAAGIASLYITGNAFAQLNSRKFTGDGKAPCCAQYSQFRTLARGLDWMAKHFTAKKNPNGSSWYYYYLYGVERVGILSGMRYFGEHDWYREGATQLVLRQDPNGSWREHHPVADTSFALLFLAKGRRPLLFHKLKWSDESRLWNARRNDLSHLIDFIDDKLNGERLSWETVTLEHDVDEWLRAPILFINGHEFPEFDAVAIEKLKDYVNRGGTIFVEACCGQAIFRDQFQMFVAKAFPDYDLLKLPSNHPVYSSMFAVDATEAELFGLDVGCRTSVFFSPHDLSCPWEVGDIPEVSEKAFQIGSNIAAYATGNKPLPDKLEVVLLASRESAESDLPPPPRGALHIGQLVHNGDWQPQPLAIPNLAKLLNEQYAVDIVSQCQPLTPDDDRMQQHPILYMAGNFTFELSDEEVAALRKHLLRGGFLFSDTCCGRDAYDQSVRDLAARLFPDHPMERLPQDHPIISGEPGVALTKVAYLPVVAAEQPGLDEVWLEGVTIEGRTVLVHSPYAIGYALEGHVCPSCKGLEKDDARQLAANIILYALSY